MHTKLTRRVMLGLALALALNEPVRFRTFYRSTVVLPWALTAVVVGVMWRWMLIPDIGIVNYMLAGLGINVSFFLSPAAAMATMILVEVWRSTGYGMILVLAGLLVMAAGIPLYWLARRNR